MRLHRFPIIPALFLLFLVLVVLPALAPALAATAPLPSVTYAVIGEGAERNARHFMGRIEAVNVVDVHTRTAGFIKAIGFREGQMVQAGDLLFEMDPELYLAEVEQAKARVASEEARFELAELMNNRMQPLARTNTVSQADADRAHADFITTRAALAQATAALHARELELSYTRITAPITGRVGLTPFSVGSFVNAGSGALVNIVQLDPVRVVISVREKDFIEAVQPDGDNRWDVASDSFAPVLRLANGSVYTEKGTFDSIGNQINPNTGTVDLRARFANPNRMLLPGGVVDVTLSPEDAPLRPLVPAMALQQDRDGFFVLALDDNDSVVIQRITLGIQVDQDYTVTGGLKVGDRVIVEGVQRVQSGIKVNPVAASPLMP